MKPVDLLPGARRDFDASFDWYAERSAIAAQMFSHAVDDSLSRIAANPERFVLVDDRHRECSVKRFPFRVVFREEPTHVLVVAIAHAKRRPGYWRER